MSRGARNIPKAFEIFTGDQTLILKPKDGKNAEEWVQCLSIVVAHSQVSWFELQRDSDEFQSYLLSITVSGQRHPINQNE